MKIKTKSLIILLLLIVQNSVQIIRDISFLRFCDNLGGHHDKIVETDAQTRGDRCTITWPVPVEDKEHAKEYCNLWYMYPTSGYDIDKGQPKCTYENVYECRPDYTLIHGHCYRFASEKFVTFHMAKHLCVNQGVRKTQDPGLVNLYDRDLIRLFKAYFVNMKMFFIRNDETSLDQIDYKDKHGSGQYAVAFGMAQFYKTGPGSVIELPKNRRARAMCVYRAKDTPLSLAYKIQKLAPYYYPFNVVNNMMIVWRTVGHYSTKIENDGMIASKQCEASMKAIVGWQKDDSKGDVWDDLKGDAWDATKKNLQALTADFKKSIVKSLAPYSYCCVKYGSGEHTDRFSLNCPFNSDWSHYAVFRTHHNSALHCQQYPELNDQTYPAKPHGTDAKLPITFLFYPETVKGLNIVQNNHVAIRAPVLCNIHYEETRKASKCDDGWTPYKRDNGLTVCHKVFNERHTYDSALDFCINKHGSLSTFTTDDEYMLLVKQAEKLDVGIWLGMRKKRGCPVVSSGSCSRENIVDFVHTLFGDDSYKVRAVIATKWLKGEPNNEANNEWCIHKLNDAQKINDVNCMDNRWTPACIKAATVI